MVEEVEIAAGFKKTDIGLLPNDWDVLSLGSFTDLLTGFPFPSAEFANNGIRLLRGSNIKRGNTDWSKDITKYWHSATFELRTYELKDGDIVVAMDGSLVGKSFAQLRENDLPALLLQRVARIRTEKADINYLKQFVCSKFFTQYCESVKTASAIPHISPKNIKDYKIPLPPTKAEQTAIATALSDIDALIEDLEKLLVKKRNIKQGAMQELLRPKEGWHHTTLLELADNKKELFDDGDWIEAEHITNVGIRILQTGNIGIGKYVEKEAKKFLKEKSFYKLKCKLLKVGDLLVCRLAEPAGRACVLPNIGEDKIVTSVDVTIFRPSEKIVNRIFLVHLFSTSDWFKQVTEKVGGTTHKRIARSSLGKIEIQVPKFEEQNEIAKVLFDMENEIEQLETQLSKYKMLKTGMMQDLLTGKKRLV